VSENPPAGWYPDPQDGTKQRYWDGTAWTEHTAPGAQQAQPAATGGFTAATGGVGLGAQAPDPWLWQSIVATIICCLPTGIAGIIYAAKSQKAAGMGDLAGATAAAGTAKTWTLVSIGVGVLVGLAFIAFIALGAAAEFTQY